MEHTENKLKCFVMQQFDNGGFYDKRYSETIVPALSKAGVEVQRADKILGLNPIVDKIEKAIREADICLAEISENNPNVWLEVGYAYSLRKATLLICDKNIRDKLPFDVSHRPVIFYDARYRSGFDDLEKKITQEIEDFVRQSKIRIRDKPIVDSIKNINIIDTLSIEAQLALFLLMDSEISNCYGMSGWQLGNMWSEYSIDKNKIAFALAKLKEKEFITERIENDGYNDEPYKTYSLTPLASIWINEHPELYDSISSLYRNKNKKEKVPAELAKLMDDEIPF